MDKDTTLAVIDLVEEGQGAQASPSSKKRTTADMLEESEQLLAKKLYSPRAKQLLVVRDARMRLLLPTPAVWSRLRRGRQRVVHVILSQVSLDAAFCQQGASEFIRGHRNKPHYMCLVEHIIITAILEFMLRMVVLACTNRILDP